MFTNGLPLLTGYPDLSGRKPRRKVNVHRLTVQALIALILLPACRWNGCAPGSGNCDGRGAYIDASSISGNATLFEGNSD